MLVMLHASDTIEFSHHDYYIFLRRRFVLWVAKAQLDSWLLDAIPQCSKRLA
jgi:hypothetical protein